MVRFKGSIPPTYIRGEYVRRRKRTNQQMFLPHNCLHFLTCLHFLEHPYLHSLLRQHLNHCQQRHCLQALYRLFLRPMQCPLHQNHLNQKRRRTNTVISGPSVPLNPCRKSMVQSTGWALVNQVPSRSIFRPLRPFSRQGYHRPSEKGARRSSQSGQKRPCCGIAR